MRKEATTAGIGTGIPEMEIPEIRDPISSILPVWDLIRKNIRFQFILPVEFLALVMMKALLKIVPLELWYMEVLRHTAMIKVLRKLRIPKPAYLNTETGKCLSLKQETGIQIWNQAPKYK